MEAIAGSIAVRKEQVGKIWIRGCIKEEFVKDGEQSNGVRLRADSSIETPNSGVGDVIFVVGGVQVYPIPARGEVDLGAEGNAVFRGEANILGRTSCCFTHDGNGELGLIRRVQGTVNSVSELVRKVENPTQLTVWCCLPQSFGNQSGRQGRLQTYCSIEK